jgi:hypothetical protein
MNSKDVHVFQQTSDPDSAQMRQVLVPQNSI